MSTDAAGLSALRAPPLAPWRIGIDVGGTFTDLVLTDSAAVSQVVKVPSVPADPSQGVLSALQRLAANLDCTVRDVLRLRAVRAWLDGGDEPHAGGQGRQGRAADYSRVS